MARKLCDKCRKPLPPEANEPRSRQRVCDDCRRAYSADWARKNRKPSSRRFRAANVSVAEYECMFRDQSGVCMICKQPESAVDPRTKRPRPLSVDHDHSTGEVRGLLCHRCNMSLGLIRDDPDTAFAAMQYLGEPEKRANGGNWDSLGKMLQTVEAIHSRVDGTNERIDMVVTGQEGIREALHALRETTNDALHAVEARVNTLERPWRLLAGGWVKAGAAAGAATAITGLIAKFVGLGWLPF